MNTSTLHLINDEKFILHRTKFVILITGELLSIGLSLCIFAFFLTHRILLQTTQHQALLLLLIITFIHLTVDLPMPIHYYLLGYVNPATIGYCTWWTFLEFTLNLASEAVMATISIQRHLLIFQAHIFNIRRNRYLFHYIPLLLCIMYPIIFYLTNIVFYSCDGTQWDFTSNGCGYVTCYLVYDKVLATYDLLGNNGLPISIIILANVALIIRVIRQKYRRQQIVSWRRQRRMTLQLLGISMLYLFAWLPTLFIVVMQQLTSSNFGFDVLTDYVGDLIYLIYLFLPWIYLGLLPEFRKWIRKFLHRDGIHGNRVRPAHTV